MIFKRARWMMTMGSTALLILAMMGCRQDRAQTQPTVPPSHHGTTGLPATEPSHDAPPRSPVY